MGKFSFVFAPNPIFVVVAADAEPWWSACDSEFVRHNLCVCYFRNNTLVELISPKKYKKKNCNISTQYSCILLRGREREKKNENYTRLGVPGGIRPREEKKKKQLKASQMNL